VANVIELLDNEASYAAMAKAHNPYGDGKACARIVSVLERI
jgi:UDP-N-acetylglucosamine 2-epimerase (non-hydrolysing)